MSEAKYSSDIMWPLERNWWKKFYTEAVTQLLTQLFGGLWTGSGNQIRLKIMQMKRDQGKVPAYFCGRGKVLDFFPELSFALVLSPSWTAVSVSVEPFLSRCSLLGRAAESYPTLFFTLPFLHTKLSLRRVWWVPELVGGKQQKHDLLLVFSGTY